MLPKCTLFLAFLATGALALTGGRLAGQGQFPSNVGLSNVFGFHFCSGLIVNNQWILTTANCVWEDVPFPENVKVNAGSTKLAGGTRYDVDRIVVHGSFLPTVLANDVAVIHTIQPINFNANVQPAPLVSRDLDSGEEVQIPGWGRASLTGALSPDLQFIISKTLTNEQCSNLVSINPDNFCTDEDIGVGICIGDSGTGVYVKDEGVAGIGSSFYQGCGIGNPDGLTSVAYHRNWIILNTN